MKRLTRAPNFNFSFPRFAVVLVVGSIPPNISLLDNPCSRSRNPDRTRVYKNQSNSIKIRRPFAKQIFAGAYDGCIPRAFSPLPSPLRLKFVRRSPRSLKILSYHRSPSREHSTTPSASTLAIIPSPPVLHARSQYLLYSKEKKKRKTKLYTLSRSILRLVREYIEIIYYAYLRTVSNRRGKKICSILNNLFHGR